LQPQRILVIQTAFLGDVILATPLVRSLKKNYPAVKVDVLTIPSTSSVFQYNPHINQRLVFDKKQKLKKWVSFFQLINALRKNHYDAAVSIQSSLTSALLMRLAKIPCRVGFERQKFLTHPIEEVAGLHTRERYLRLLRPFSNKNFDSQTEMFWSAAEESSVNKIVDPLRQRAQFVIGIAPGSVWPTKRWLEPYFVSLIKNLNQESIAIVLLGGRDETQLCDRIKTLSGNTAVNLAGQLTIPQSAALISRLNLMLTNDSAPLHIANAVATDVIAFFGPTVPEFGFFPFREYDQVLEVNELYCRPCAKHGGRRCPQKHFRCMTEIRPEMAQKAILLQLEPQSSAK